MNIPYANYIMMIFASPVIFYFGRNYFINSWKQAKQGDKIIYEQGSISLTCSFSLYYGCQKI
jgi:hypothetical protein